MSVANLVYSHAWCHREGGEGASTGPGAVVVEGTNRCCSCSKQAHVHRKSSAQEPGIALWRLACRAAAYATARGCTLHR